VELFVTLGLFVIFCTVLVLPFAVKKIEENLEIFLFVCGVAALTLAGFTTMDGETTGWTADIVIEALTSPLNIASVGGIPIGIVQIVLVVGILIYCFHHQMESAINKMVESFSLKVIVPLLIIVLGLVASVISAILAAIILIEIVNSMPLPKEGKIEITVIACFAIGLGARAHAARGTPDNHRDLQTIRRSLSRRVFVPDRYDRDLPCPCRDPVGGPRSYRAQERKTDESNLKCTVEREELSEVVIRAGKVYLFIMALTFLGSGFKPLVAGYIDMIPSAGLYWVNMVSAVLDNATLAAAEINPSLSLTQITSALMGLLISGGMLIQGNIPNIIAAGKMGITSKEWARVGIPLGLALMAGFFCILFIPAWLGFA
jgi:Predicted cation transporter